MSPSAILDVQGRIAAIQARFGAAAGAPTGRAFAAELQTATSRLPSTQEAGTTPAAAAAPAPAAVTPAVARAVASAAPAAPRPPAAASGPSGADVVAAARDYLGVPYVRGGNSPAQGLDCSGLTELVYSRFGIDLAPVSWQQVEQGRAVDGLSDARPGDLVFFGRPTHHVGIYIGDGKMIHAPRPGKEVEVAKVYETPSAIRRVLPETTSAGATRGRTGGAATGPYADLFNAAAAEHGVPARLLSAVAKVESGYRADAVSPAGARGLMQIMPGTARELGVDPMDPARAVDGAARLLKSHLRTFGSTELALAAYNAGPGAVRKHDGIPPYEETQGYVRKVMAAYTGGPR